MREAGATEMAPDLDLLRADDGIRTRDPHLGKAANTFSWVSAVTRSSVVAGVSSLRVSRMSFDSEQ